MDMKRAEEDPDTSARTPLAAEIARYRPRPDHRDEMVDADGTIRPHWRHLADHLCHMPEEDWRSANDSAERLLVDDSVIHLARDEEDATPHPWRLDLVPYLLSMEEWAELERGLVQRATLLNAVLADLYGQRKLLSNGVLPPALIYGNPEFHRACHGIEPPRGTHLHFVAFDLARGQDGQWWVLSDRTQAPSGVGYALENRIVTSRCLPDLVSAANVQRLATFFRLMSEHLIGLTRRDDALAVVLTPGAARENYFEHAYLARYLGFTLAEGGDLTVRDDRLYLKTVEGLRPVDLVFRRTSTRWCDPLELRTDSKIGVPGLAQVARSGNVVIANALGSGLVETDALLGFIAPLCRSILGEDPLIPSVPTWWCGQQSAKDHVIGNMERMIIRRTVDDHTLLSPGRDTTVGAELDERRRAALIERVSAKGHEFIGQEPLTVSTAPYWGPDGKLHAAPLTLRVYVAATRQGYRLMPGGLARVNADRPYPAPWLKSGDVTKDTWVPWDGAVEQYSMLEQSRRQQGLRRSDDGLPSRVADDLYWLGRYAERAERLVRLLRSLVDRLSGDKGAGTDPRDVARMLSLLVAHGHAPADLAERINTLSPRAVERELARIVSGDDAQDGLDAIVGNVRRIADLVRERLSVDTWRIIEDLTQAERSARFRHGVETSDAGRMLDGLVLRLAAFNGMVMENMTRGLSWRFLDLGRRIERARGLTRLTRDLLTQREDSTGAAIELLLELADSSITYRTRYRLSPTLATVLDLLLMDETNPRSLMRQIESIEEHLQHLPRITAGPALDTARRVVLEVATEVRLLDVTKIADGVATGARGSFHRTLTGLEDHLGALSEAVTRGYFVHAAAKRAAGPRASGSET